MPSINLETVKAKIGLKYLITIIGVVVSCTTTVVVFAVNSASKSEVTAAINEHSHTVHTDASGNPLSAPATIKDDVEHCKSTIETLQSDIHEIKKDIKHSIETQSYIKARIDLLLEQKHTWNKNTRIHTP